MGGRGDGVGNAKWGKGADPKCRLVDQVVGVGQGRPFLASLITLVPDLAATSRPRTRIPWCPEIRTNLFKGWEKIVTPSLRGDVGSTRGALSEHIEFSIKKPVGRGFQQGISGHPMNLADPKM